MPHFGAKWHMPPLFAQAPIQLSLDSSQTQLPGNFPLNITQPAIDVFLASKQDDGQIDGLVYWQVANGYTAIALHDAWSNTSSNTDVLEDLVSKVQNEQQDCINVYNDDTMWWSIGLLELYEVTQNVTHLTVAGDIWNHVRNSVISPGEHVVNGVDMAGGVIWTTKPNETQVNAITTGLFSELSARLSLIYNDASAREVLLGYAIFSLDWILRCRYIEDDFVVLDHIDIATNQTVDSTYTYNTGQAIAASVAIYDAIKVNNSDPLSNAHTYLDLAGEMALYSMNRTSWIDGDGTLTERDAYPGTGPNPAPAWENCDGVGFKAILLRNLAKLYRTLRREDVNFELQGTIKDFVEHQFWSLQDRDTNGHDQYGPWWAGPMDLATSHSQLAALDVMAAIHAVQ
ncbi:hypothetical protein LTR67_003589 [Exophiala xenobiotica]